MRQTGWAVLCAFISPDLSLATPAAHAEWTPFHCFVSLRQVPVGASHDRNG